MKCREEIKKIIGEEPLTCPFCNSKNIDYKLAFRHCDNCDSDFDYSDYLEAENPQPVGEDGK